MSHEQSELRPLIEVQRAHDILVGIILEPQLCPNPGPQRNALIGAADVLCWVLKHSHNSTFERNLAQYLSYAKALGFNFDPIPKDTKPRTATQVLNTPLPQFMESFNQPPDPVRDLERMIKLTLDEKGPMPFNMLLGEVRAGLSIEPATLHDALNNMLSAGLLKLAPTGFYLLG